MEKTTTKPRRKPIKASQLTKQYWEKLGWRVAFVERYLAVIHKRFDAWGFADHLAFNPFDIQNPSAIVALQSCAVDRMSDHRRTISESSLAQEWMKVGHRIIIMAWERGKKRGMKNRLVMEEQRLNPPA